MITDEQIGEAPCDKCFRVLECGIEKKACVSFWQYVETNRYNKKTRKIPTEDIYEKIFDENDMTLKDIKAYAKAMVRKEIR